MWVLSRLQQPQCLLPNVLLHQQNTEEDLQSTWTRGAAVQRKAGLQPSPMSPNGLEALFKLAFHFTAHEDILQPPCLGTNGTIRMTVAAADPCRTGLEPTQTRTLLCNQAPQVIEAGHYLPRCFSAASGRRRHLLRKAPRRSSPFFPRCLFSSSPRLAKHYI